jgi:hypothetical protein
MASVYCKARKGKIDASGAGQLPTFSTELCYIQILKIALIEILLDMLCPFLRVLASEAPEVWDFFHPLRGFFISTELYINISNR